MHTRFERLSLPTDFEYLDHPFIDHKKSDYVITLDDEVQGGWKVCRPDGRRRNPQLVDVCYFTRVDDCIDFVEMVTWSTLVNFGYERTKPRSAVRYER